MVCDPCNNAVVMMAIVNIRKLVESCRSIPKSESILHTFEQIATQRMFIDKNEIDDKKNIDNLMTCELDLIEIWLNSCEAKMSSGEQRRTTLRRLNLDQR